MKAIKRTSIAALGVAAAVAALLTGCSASPAEPSSSGSSDVEEATFDTVTPGTLTLAVYNEQAPALTYTDTSISGLMGDALTGFAEEHGLDIEIVQTTFASAIQEVQQGRVDFGLNVFHNAERAATVFYTVSHIKFPAAVITRADFDFEDTESLRGKKIGVVLGTVWTQSLQAEYGEENIVQYQVEAEAAQALINGQVDAYVNGLLVTKMPPLAGRTDIVGHTVEAGTAGIPEELLFNTSYLIANCDDTALVEAYDSYVEGLVASGGWEDLMAENDVDEGFRIDEPAAPEQGCGS